MNEYQIYQQQRKDNTGCMGKCIYLLVSEFSSQLQEDDCIHPQSVSNNENRLVL